MTAETPNAELGLPAQDAISRVADAVRETVPGEAGDALVAQIAGIMAEPVPDELEHLALENARLLEELAQAAWTDALTGLRNRRRFFEDLRREFQSARRYDTELTLLVIDVDDLKTVNVERGLEAGDTLIQSVAESLLTQLRITDIAARIGDNHFAVILPHTNLEGAQKVADRLFAGLPGSVDVGVAGLDADVTSAADLLERSDRDRDARRAARSVS